MPMQILFLAPMLDHPGPAASHIYTAVHLPLIYSHHAGQLAVGKLAECPRHLPAMPEAVALLITTAWTSSPRSHGARPTSL